MDDVLLCGTNVLMYDDDEDEDEDDGDENGDCCCYSVYSSVGVGAALL